MNRGKPKNGLESDTDLPSVKLADACVFVAHFRDGLS
jgi:hypothetical protein